MLIFLILFLLKYIANLTLIIFAPQEAEIFKDYLFILA
jgi:hypothetical protein